MPISNLVNGYRNFQEVFLGDIELYQRLAEQGQKPHTLWIGCSDSRVIPEHLVSAKPGDLYVLRNVANIVPPYGTAHDSIGAVIEYAVRHLNVSDIVICGHTECGGIKALDGHIDMFHEPHLARWIELARSALTQAQAGDTTNEQRLTDAIKVNVLMQRKNLETYDCVRDALKDGKLKTHGWLFDLRAGELYAYDDKQARWHSIDK